MVESLVGILSITKPSSPCRRRSKVEVNRRLHFEEKGIENMGVGPANLTPGTPMLPLPPAAPDVSAPSGQKGGQQKPKTLKPEQIEQKGRFLFSRQSC